MPLLFLTTALAALLIAPGPLRAEDAAPAAGLQATLDASAELTLASEGRHLAGNVLQIAQLKITIGEGTAVPVRAKNGEVYGVYFTGAAKWRYAAVDPAEQAAIRTNAERMAPSLFRTPDGVGDSFKSMLMLFSDARWKEAWDAAMAAGAAEPPPGRAAGDFQNVLNLVGSSWPVYEFRIATAKLNGKGHFVYAEFIGGAERVGYMYDDIGATEERLFNFRMIAGYDVRFTQRLASRVFERGGADAPSALLLEHVDIEMATPDNKRGTIRSDLALRVYRSEGTRILGLDLMNNRDPDSASWDSKNKRLTVTKVADADGKELPFAHRYGELLVEVPPLSGPEAKVRLRVETEGEVFVDLNGKHDDNYFIFLSDAWFPSPGDWNNQRFTYSLKVRTKKPWRPIASGRQVSFDETDDSFETVSRADRPSRLLTVLAGKYHVAEETIGGVTVRVHAYAMAREKILTGMPKLTAAFVDYYTKTLGPMDADELDVVEVPEYGFGISPTGVILLTTEAYKPQYEYANYFVRGINARLAHEVAHQWFGHRAVPASSEDDWLSESLAEYYSGLAMGALAAERTDLAGFPKMHAEWRGWAPDCASVGPISAAGALGGENAARDRFCLLYYRGPLVLHMLRTLVGNDRFVKATRAFLDKANSGPATTDDYAKALSAVLQKDMRWFFDDWIRRGGTPEIAVRYQVDPAGGGFRLSGSVEERPTAEGFKRLFVPLVIRYNERAEVRLVFLEKTPTSFEFELKEKPSKVEVDPAGNNLVRYK